MDKVIMAETVGTTIIVIGGIIYRNIIRNIVKRTPGIDLTKSSTTIGDDTWEEHLAVILYGKRFKTNEACAREIIRMYRHREFTEYDVHKFTAMYCKVYRSTIDAEMDKILFSFSFLPTERDKNYNYVDDPDKFSIVIDD